MQLLNLGCGQRFCEGWTNIDFTSHDKNVIAHNLLDGIPFPGNYFDVVYHSHLLEHFARTDAANFIAENYRVLKPGGVIRTVVPDLEYIARNYLRQLELALQGDKEAGLSYSWAMIEMYDQTVRTHAGGEMMDFFAKRTHTEFADSGSRIWGPLFWKTKPSMVGRMLKVAILRVAIPATQKRIKRLSERVPSLRIDIRSKLLKLLMRQEEYECYRLGKFRLSGEIHQWMYDRYSLTALLQECNFRDAKVWGPLESQIQNWASFQLDTNPDGTVYKPNSLVIEALK